MTSLAKRRPLFSRARKDWHPIMRGFHAPQRERSAKVQHPKARS